MRCDSAILPGIDLLTNDNIRRYGYGPVESAAHGVQFGQARFTWMVDSRGKILNFFNDWMSSIVNFDSKGGVDIGIESDLRETLNKADKLSKLGRVGGCYYEDNLNFHYKKG